MNYNDKTKLFSSCEKVHCSLMEPTLSFAAKDLWAMTGPWRATPASPATTATGTAAFRLAEEHPQKMNFQVKQQKKGSLHCEHIFLFKYSL